MIVRGREHGLTCVELVVALVLAVAATAWMLPVTARAWRYADLEVTANRLLVHLRTMQQLAQTHGVYGLVRMSGFTPDYALYLGNGTQCLGQYAFLPGVNYFDGYLQLNTPNIQYDVAGNSQVGGVIRLVDGPDEADIHLYLGSGLQTLTMGGAGS
ncbi:hypothetical protein GCM10010885_02230 [Alicyclobacillus cellulosilyticus]|uniref:Uncharacterized protein n=1 Tax=Alicyclobacillus cellulosilyticus TaxID=1003997 RepID=A0A917K3T7_9BACL|nr:prepilin-type cleavage/methylation domain-containing protein [Alicyclobacillus cellulosilyticus]GGI96106.1 hypothetical protein GCM10010885_02230 [Alicyclobacillus cellulosilyticus]